MKRNAPDTPRSNPQLPTENHYADSPDWAQGDPVWDLLDQVSTREPDAFFARNVVRSVRQLPTPSLSSRILGLFSSRKLAIGATACACVMIAYQVWPTAEPETSPSTQIVAQIDQSIEPSNDLSKLVIQETLLAAAEDPTIFTREEVVIMLGL